MTATEQPAPTPTQDIKTTSTRAHSSSTAKKGVLAGVVLFVACAAACSLPLLLAGGAAISLGALFSGADSIAAVLVGITALIGALWWVRRRAQRAGGFCGCGDGCGC
jgi:hypothetical protein